MMKIVVRRTLGWCVHSVYALEGVPGGTDASETPTAKPTAYVVNMMAKTAEGRTGKWTKAHVRIRDLLMNPSLGPWERTRAKIKGIDLRVRDKECRSVRLAMKQ